MEIFSYYLITMANLQLMSKTGSPLEDTSFHLGSLYELTRALVSMPDFPLDGYRTNGLQRHGNLAVYTSNNLRNFIFKGLGSPEDEGFIIKFQHSDVGGKVSKYDKVSYIIQREESDQALREISILKDLATRGHRNKRSFLDKLIP